MDTFQPILLLFSYFNFHGRSMERCKLSIAEIAMPTGTFAQHIQMDLGLEPVWDDDYVHVPALRANVLKALVIQQRL